MPTGIYIRKLIPPEIRFWKYVNKTDSCWEWIGARRRDGYGRIRVGNFFEAAHRFSWELVYGDIPSDLCVLHRCDVRFCVNPDHLFLGTNRDNIDDMVKKGRWNCNGARRQEIK